MTIRFIGTYDTGIKLFRIVRLTWNRGVPGDGRGFGTQVTLGWRWNKLFGFVTGCNEIIATAFGFRAHYRKSFGGTFAA